MGDPFDPKNLRRTACHEGAHAVVAVMLCIPFEKVHIALSADDDEWRTRRSLGRVHRTTNKLELPGQSEKAKVQLIQMLAGPIGETLAEPGLAPDWSQDADDVESILRFTFCPFHFEDGEPKFPKAEVAARRAQMDKFADECIPLARKLVIDNISDISGVAHALLQRGELSAEEVKRLCHPGGDAGSSR